MDDNELDFEIPEDCMNLIKDGLPDVLPVLKVDTEIESDSAEQLGDYSNLEASLILDSENVTEQNQINSKGETRKGKRRFVCPKCSKPFKLKHDLKRHMRIHTGGRPYLCPTCLKAFQQKHHLIRPIRSLSGERPYTCKICDKRFTQLSTLKKHVKLHSGEKPFECPECSKTFIQAVHLDFHMSFCKGNQSSAAGTSGSSSNQRDN